MASIGTIYFNSSVEVLNADNTVTIRQMNHDGRMYDVDEDFFDEDALSLHLDLDNDGMTFMDAVQDFADDGLNQSGVIDFNYSQK